MLDYRGDLSELNLHFQVPPGKVTQEQQIQVLQDSNRLEAMFCYCNTAGGFLLDAGLPHSFLRTGHPSLTLDNPDNHRLPMSHFSKTAASSACDARCTQAV